MTDYTSYQFPFGRGVFAPAPGANSAVRVVRALATLELKLFLRNGEQLMLNMLIPVAALISACVAPIGHLIDPRATAVLPGVLALAVISSAFTGQAIAVGFDRRYGALKRLGATMAPPWAIIAGKSSAVAVVVALQSILLGTIAYTFGWRPSSVSLAEIVVLLPAGAIAFAVLGLLLGGSLRAEVVLPLANILWFAQAASLAFTVWSGPAASGWSSVVALTPAGALASALRDAAAGAHFDLSAPLVLLVWSIAGGALAKRTFSFS